MVFFVSFPKIQSGNQQSVFVWHKWSLGCDWYRLQFILYYRFRFKAVFHIYRHRPQSSTLALPRSSSHIDIPRESIKPSPPTLTAKILKLIIHTWKTGKIWAKNWLQSVQRSRPRSHMHGIPRSTFVWLSRSFLIFLQDSDACAQVETRPIKVHWCGSWRLEDDEKFHSGVAKSLKPPKIRTRWRNSSRTRKLNNFWTATGWEKNWNSLLEEIEIAKAKSVSHHPKIFQWLMSDSQLMLSSPSI